MCGRCLEQCLAYNKYCICPLSSLVLLHWDCPRGQQVAVTFIETRTVRKCRLIYTTSILFYSLPSSQGSLVKNCTVLPLLPPGPLCQTQPSTLVAAHPATATLLLPQALSSSFCKPLCLPQLMTQCFWCLEVAVSFPRVLGGH